MYAVTPVCAARAKEKAEDLEGRSVCGKIRGSIGDLPGKRGARALFVKPKI